MTLWETIKKPFLPEPDKEELTSKVPQTNTIDDFESEDIYNIPTAFFDEEPSLFSMGSGVDTKLEKQKQKIMAYRNLAKIPEVSDGIDEIVNEVVNVLGDETPIRVQVDEENQKLQEKISESFEKINKLMSTKKSMYSVVRNAYIDGQVDIHLAYKEKNQKDGIQKITMMEPVYLYYDAKKGLYKYKAKDTNFYSYTGIDKNKEFSKEEIVHSDFGLKEDGVNLSFLDNTIKVANQLSTLEDLLIPLRFSRSVSRRVFNVDIGDLPPKKGEQAMRDYQRKFKYKKYYNTETGEVSNQQHVTSMVEDYWFSNRSGGKGTQVDVLDETGNLGELGDILYFYKKLYRSMKIPSNRIPGADDNEFDYNDSRTTKEDIKFFMFINRVRQTIADLYKEILRRELISTGVLSNDEWSDFDEKIKITFVNSNTFVEKMALDNFMSKLDNYSTALEQKGTFGIRKIIRDVFGYTDDEINNMIKAAEKEKTDPLLKQFYEEPDNGF
jgi:hypothetical protein